MKLIAILLLLIFNLFSLSGCASEEGLPPPCDQYATFCGTKTKINTW